MCESGSYDTTVYEGQSVQKSGRLNMFHFGGSACCLEFRPKIKIDFDLHEETPGLEAKNLPVHGTIATILDAVEI